MSNELKIIDKKLSADYAKGLTAERIEMVRENMDGDTLRVFDLTRLTVPSGSGAAVWNLGNSAPKHIDGVVLSAIQGRSYWKSREISGTPPDCHSEDGVVGIGDPGGPCISCPFNQFGSAEVGRGKACKETANLLVSIPGHTLPVVVKVPPASLTEWKQYKMGLASTGVSFKRIVTRFGLKRVEGNPSYFKVTCEAIGLLDEDTLGLMLSMGRLIGESLGSRPALPAPPAEQERKTLPPPIQTDDDGTVTDSGEVTPF